MYLEDHVTVPAFFSSEGNLSITPQNIADPANQLNYLLNKEGKINSSMTRNMFRNISDFSDLVNYLHFL